MDNNRLLEIQSSRGAQITTSSSKIITIEKAVQDCREFIQERANEYNEFEAYKKKAIIKELIVKYAMRGGLLVEGFIDDENHLDTNKFINRLVAEITDYGILSNAMSNDDIFEIRLNGKEIKVEIKGKVHDLVDNEGNIVSFTSPSQQETILTKLLGDVRLTPKDALANASTIEGYRLAAVHKSATSFDPLDPGADLYHVGVLRKLKKNKMELPDIVKTGSLSDNMARLMNLGPLGGMATWIVGPTGSGKTSASNAMLQATPPAIRLILLQNPSEIDARKRDLSNRVFNDVIHLEAIEKEHPTATDPTSPNMMAHILRLSPDLVGFGEIRTPREFELAVQIAQAGHPFYCTFHAVSAKEAIMRYLIAYLSAGSNVPANLALRVVTSIVDFIVVSDFLRDGTRKIIQISEVIGISSNNLYEPEINDLYIFDIKDDDEPEVDDEGNVLKIHGRHKRIGKLSPNTIKKFKLRGVPRSRYDFLLDDPEEDEIELYTGENILRYGLKKVL